MDIFVFVGEGGFPAGRIPVVTIAAEAKVSDSDAIKCGAVNRRVRHSDSHLGNRAADAGEGVFIDSGDGSGNVNRSQMSSVKSVLVDHGDRIIQNDLCEIGVLVEGGIADLGNGGGNGERGAGFGNGLTDQRLAVLGVKHAVNDLVFGVAAADGE